MDQNISNANPEENFQPLLKDSIALFLSEHPKGVTDFSHISSIFCRLLQQSVDPPLEVLWFYSRIVFHSTKIAAQDSSRKFCVAVELFQLLASCSSPYNADKKIAVLAPVIYELYHLVVYGRELQRDFENLSEGIVGYISMCCQTEHKETNSSSSLNPSFVDSVRVWVVDRIGRNFCLGEELRVFFPLVSHEFCKGMSLGCEVGYLAGIVMSEVFLLRLCLNFGLGTSKTELEKDAKSLVVRMITGFRSYYFLDILLRMLLEPNFPVISLLGNEDKITLREILYDIVIMVEHSLFNPQRGIPLASKRFKNLALTWLFVANNAIQSVSGNGDQTKAISYANAFCKSSIPAQLIKWVTYQIGKGGNMDNPNVSSPVALIKWLQSVEDQGIRVFDCGISQTYAGERTCKMPVTKSDGKNLGKMLVLCDTNQWRGRDRIGRGRLALNSMVNACLAASFLAEPNPSDATRKRKGGKKEEETQVKITKYNTHHESMEGNGFDVDRFSNGCEVDNPFSGEDVEFMEL